MHRMRREWWRGKVECLRGGVVYNLACSVSAVCCKPINQSESGVEVEEGGLVTILHFMFANTIRSTKFEGIAGMP